MTKLPAELRILPFILIKGKVKLMDISKKLDITYSHVVNIINDLEKRGFVVTEREGRNRWVRISDERKADVKKLSVALIILSKSTKKGGE